MDERKLARAIGWLSIGVGAVLVATPARGTRGFGMGERPNLGRFLGARHLVIGAALLRGGNLASWLKVRAISDAGDAALLIGGVATGAFPRGKAMFGVAVATGLSVSSFVLASRMQ